MDWGKRIGANLKQMRTERNLTLGQLSGLAGISKAMLSEMEKLYEASPDDPEILEQYCDFMENCQWTEGALYPAAGGK